MLEWRRLRSRRLRGAGRVVGHGLGGYPGRAEAQVLVGCHMVDDAHVVMSGGTAGAWRGDRGGTNERRDHLSAELRNYYNLVCYTMGTTRTARCVQEEE